MLFLKNLFRFQLLLSTAETQRPTGTCPSIKPGSLFSMLFLSCPTKEETHWLVFWPSWLCCFFKHPGWFQTINLVFITGLALNHILQNNFKESNGMRPNSKRIGVLITDGKSQDDVIEHSQNLRDQGIELYAIGEQRSADLILHR